MAERNENTKLLGSVARLKELFKKEKSCFEAQINNALVVGNELAFIKGVVKHGQFATIVFKAIGLRSSQYSVYLRLYKHKDDIKAAQSWAGEQLLASSTVTDIYKILPKWMRRGEPASSKLPATTRPRVSDLTSEQRAQILLKHEVLSNPPMSDHGETDNAEITLLRLATAYNVLVGRLLKEVGLEVPPLLLDRVRAAAAQPSSASVEELSEIVHEVEMGKSEATIEVEASAICIDISGSAAKSDATDLRRECPSVEKIFAMPVKQDVSVIHSIPALRYSKTYKRAGRSMCLKGAARMLELESSGADVEMISTNLRGLGFDFCPSKVRDYIARNKALAKQAP